MCRLAKSPLVKNYEMDFNQTLTDSTSTFSIDSEYLFNSLIGSFKAQKDFAHKQYANTVTCLESRNLPQSQDIRTTFNGLHMNSVSSLAGYKAWESLICTVS